ncbi:MAG: hypothetical protein GY945_03685 [Rhodobacteraceae bacterium]|nr:hypothetical protein [Paracoccaceae bacterium]
MTYTNTPSRTKTAAILVTSAAMVLFAASGAKAADDDVGMIFDSGKTYDNCALDGGTFSETLTTYSCTINGKTTTCDKNPADKDAACSTEKSARVFGGRFGQTAPTGQVVIAPSGKVTTRRFGSVFTAGSMIWVTK